MVGFCECKIASFLAHELGQAKVCDLDMAGLVDEDVFRLDVPVDNSRVVSELQGCTNLWDDFQGFFGAEVTGVESTGKLEMLRAIGADQVIDYTQEDFTKSGETYDFILDLVGKSSFSGCIRSLKKNGRYLIADPGLSQMARGRWSSLISRLPGRQTGKKVIFGAAYPKSEDLAFLRKLIEAGKIKTVIDRCYPLEQIPEAHSYVETGRKKGNVVITVAAKGKT